MFVLLYFVYESQYLYAYIAIIDTDCIKISGTK